MDAKCAADVMTTSTRPAPVTRAVAPKPAERPLLWRHGCLRLPDETRSPAAARIWRQALGPKPDSTVPAAI